MNDARLHSTGWLFAIPLAFIVHLIALALALFSPSFQAYSPRSSDIQTVELINVLDLAARPAAPPGSTVETGKKEPPAKIVTPAIVPKKPLSPLNPVGARDLKKIAGPPAHSAKDLISYNPVKQREDALKKIEARVQERITNEQLLKARLEQLKAVNIRQVTEEKAREAARNAIAELKDIYHQNPGKTGKQRSEPTALSVGAGGSTKKLLDDKQVSYWTSALIHIQKFWTLPDLQGWDKTLEAVYVIHVQRDGGIKKKYFERKSENLYFNTFVEKAVKDADPLPAFPADFQDNEMEIGLIFHPAGLL